ncbi:GntR family transcriptional regulator [Clostridium sp. BJN0001]|uniref:winged helix-turn-helix domain-containing protein n=1 Tax=Clostridium sp. BJN0001 TaxID=2930219 RepID=UPI001FD0F873|nr:GntR family transcriptional regulator [Clostridium sp. BJN0001]
MKVAIDRRISIPLYKQVADYFEKLIKNGIFKEGEKLPTETELAYENDLSKGTVKKAYDFLENMYYVKRVRGSGTFVIRKSQTFDMNQANQMAADTFSKLSFMDMKDVYKIIKKELSKKFDVSSIVNVVLINSYPEIKDIILKQLEKIRYARITLISEDEIKYLKKASYDSYDIVAISTSSIEDMELINIITQNYKNIDKLAFRLTEKSAIEIAKISTYDKIAVLYNNIKFYNEVKQNLKKFNKNNIVTQYKKDLECDVLIVPPNYDKKFKDQFYKSAKKVIEFEYLIDSGSLYRLKKKIEKIYNMKNEKREDNEF